MAKDIIRNIWNKGKRKEKKMSRSEIEGLLRPDIRRHSLQLKIFVWIYLGVLIAAACLCVLNIAAYQHNHVMVVVQSILTGVSLACAGYALYLLRQISESDRADVPLVTSLQKRLNLVRTKFEIWYVVIAMSVGLLSFAFSVYLDREVPYRINKPMVFVATLVFQFLFIYVINRIAHYPLIRTMRAYVQDLENQVMEQTVMVQNQRKIWKKWATILMIIGIMLLIWGIIRAIQFNQ